MVPGHADALRGLRAIHLDGGTRDEWYLVRPRGHSPTATRSPGNDADPAWPRPPGVADERAEGRSGLPLSDRVAASGSQAWRLPGRPTKSRGSPGACSKWRSGVMASPVAGQDGAGIGGSYGARLQARTMPTVTVDPGHQRPVWPIPSSGARVGVAPGATPGICADRHALPVSHVGSRLGSPGRTAELDEQQESRPFFAR
jgi:hypothetical protein